MLEQDDDETGEAGPDKDPDDETLLRRLKRWERLARNHWSGWRENARREYDFTAGHQWSADDKSALLDQMRQPVTFNRIGPMVDAVTGAEILNRQEVRYLPREQGDVQVNEIITAADEWARELADTEDEESDAFADVVICGMGWTESRMDYSDDPEGRIVDDRIDPLEMWSDPQAKKRCIADAKYIIRGRWRDKSDLPEKWRAKLKTTDDTTSGNPVDDPETGSTGPRDDYEREDARHVDGADKDKRQVFIRHFQWSDKEDAYRISDEATGQAITVDAKKLKQIGEMFIAQGMKPPEHVKIQQNKYKQAIVAGNVILEQSDIECNAFTFKCITGKRDRNANTFYGVVRAMTDPQMWGNKFFTQMMHIINTAAKGGVMYESGSFANPRKAIEDWAKPDAAIELQRGALTGNKAAVQERLPAVFPVGLDKMMTTAFDSMPLTSGISLETLGLVERDQPAVLEVTRKKAGYAILAVFFDSLRRYRKMKGRVRLYFIQHYISDGRLIRIKGKDSTMQYIPLVKQEDTATYDVIVDEAPMSPNQKEATWGMMQAMMPMLAKIGVPPEIWQVMLEYSPLPSSVSGKINQIISQKAQEPPPPDPEMMKIQAKVEADKAQMQMDAESEQRKAQLEQAKMEQELAIEREKAAMELEVEKIKLQMEAEKTRHELAAMQQKAVLQQQADRQKMAMQGENHQLNLQFEEKKNEQTLRSAEQMSAIKATGARKPAKPEPKAKRKFSIKRDATGRMSEIAGSLMPLTPTTRATVNDFDNAVTTGSFTPSDNSLLVACVTWQNSAGGVSTCALTGTGGASALSWTSRANASVSGGNAMRAQIFTAPITTGAASTVTATITSGSGDNIALAIVEFTGHDVTVPTGVNLGATTGPRSGAYTPALSGTSAATSYVVAAGIVDGASGDATVGATWTSVYSVLVGGFAMTLDEYKSGALSTADWAKFDSSFSTAAAAIEIFADTGVKNAIWLVKA